MVADLKKNINRLISLYEKAKFDNKAINDENQRLSTLIDEKDRKISELEEKIEKLRLADAFATASGDKAEAKKKIGRIVREIDKCMAMLNN